MTERARILIADDEEIFLQSTTTLLLREGYECTCATDAASTLALLHHTLYDLLIADITMQGNEALELVQDVSHLAKGLPIILVTGYPSLQSAIRAIQLPVVSYLVKPFELSEFLITVRSAIQRSQVYRAIDTTRQQLRDWHHTLENFEEVIATSSLDVFSEMIAPSLLQAIVSGPALLGRESSNGQLSSRSESLSLSAINPEFHVRAQRLEHALYKIASNLVEAGILTSANQPPFEPSATQDLYLLSSRELEILRALCSGQRVPAIARALYLSPHTVRSHLKSIFRKVGVHSQTELLERFGPSSPKHEKQKNRSLRSF
jgi:DNA-binding NarL/FixJ family response regulator